MQYQRTRKRQKHKHKQTSKTAIRARGQQVQMGASRRKKTDLKSTHVCTTYKVPQNNSFVNTKRHNGVHGDSGDLSPLTF